MSIKGSTISKPSTSSDLESGNSLQSKWVKKPLKSTPENGRKRHRAKTGDHDNICASNAKKGSGIVGVIMGKKRETCSSLLRYVAIIVQPGCLLR